MELRVRGLLIKMLLREGTLILSPDKSRQGEPGDPPYPYFNLFLCGRGGERVLGHSVGTRGQLPRITSLSLHHEDSTEQIVTLGSKHLYPVTHFTSSVLSFKLKCFMVFASLLTEPMLIYPVFLF